MYNCPQCRIFDPNIVGEAVATDVETPESTVNDNFDVEHKMESAKESLNSSFFQLDKSPLKTHSVKSHSKSALGKCRLVQVEKVVAKRISTVLNVKESVDQRRKYEWYRQKQCSVKSETWIN